MTGRTQLVYIMDPMCSWCWGFAPVMAQLQQQASAAGVGLQLVVGGLRREQSRMDAAGRERIQGYWRDVQQLTGQPFDFEKGLPSGLVYDTDPACRALVTARELDSSEAALRLAMRLQEAFYCQGRDITRAAEILHCVEQAGLPVGEFAEHFDSALVREATEADYAWAGNLGISGFPTLLAERDRQLALLTNGFQPQEALAPLLERWLAQAVHD